MGVPQASANTLDVYHLLTKLFVLLDDADRRFFLSYGLSARQFWALRYLDEHRGLSMVDLSRALLTDKSNITAIVDRLELAGFARRSPDQTDRRVILITLTPAGRALRDEVNYHHELRIQELVGAVDASRFGELVELLNPINRNLETVLGHPVDGPSPSNG